MTDPTAELHFQDELSTHYESPASAPSRRGFGAVSTSRWERRRAPRRPTNRPVKLLDLIANRFHAGMVRNSSETGMLVELALPPHMQVGQRVRFIVATGATVARRSNMRSARIVRMWTTASDQVRLGLQFMPDLSD